MERRPPHQGVDHAGQGGQAEVDARHLLEADAARHPRLGAPLTSREVHGGRGPGLFPASTHRHIDTLTRHIDTSVGMAHGCVWGGKYLESRLHTVEEG